VLTAAVCAVVAGYRSYTAIAEWVADLPAATAVLLGIDPDRRPSEAMIRRLLQALDADTSWPPPASTPASCWPAPTSTPRPTRSPASVRCSTTSATSTVSWSPPTRLHCQREHVAYLARRGAHWILTVKGNQPGLHQQLAGLPWRLVPHADRDTTRGHGRREIRTLKILSVSTGIDFPNAVQAMQIQRRRRRLDEPKRFTTWRRGIGVQSSLQPRAPLSW
jgi:hypothetical protein